ncbi:MAG TPA: GNAT family N-acetyltransferase [Verrucomicrobiae bacterium]|jgi:GNAT superfamily N-acetyltransferase|nr:GNAT family N-acetyltransferase [Verrucomicrobiae bacterium]
MKIALREARPVDYGFARQLFDVTMRDRIEAIIGWDEYRQDMSFARKFVLGEVRVITLRGKDVGWIQTRIEGSAMTLLQFYVVPELQGRGIGTLVLKRLTGDAKRRGKLMALSVLKGNPAIRLFLRHGFRPTHADAYEIYMRQAVKLPLRGMGPSMGMRRG